MLKYLIWLIYTKNLLRKKVLLHLESKRSFNYKHSYKATPNVPHLVYVVYRVPVSVPQIETNCVLVNIVL